MAERTIEELQAELDTYKEQFGKINHPYPKQGVVDHTTFYSGQHFLIGFLSDTHFGSKLARYAELDTAYKVFQEEGVERVYHSGDLVDGIGVFRGQFNEVHAHTFEDQLTEVIQNYPLVDKLKTYFIEGNHDFSFTKQNGVSMGRAISGKRRDLVYLGQVEADIKIARKITLRLKHPGGGGAYALSYPLQKEINALEGGRKPQILAEGHRHTAFYVDYRNIHALQVPCFQYQSLFMKEKGLMPTCGFYLVEMHIKDGSINRFRPELFKYF